MNIMDIGGKVVKENDTYQLKDNTTLDNLVVSSTRLHPNRSTTGHSHPGQEEVYNFVEGSGRIYLDDVPHNVGQGDVVLIKSGVHHRVVAYESGLYFVCVFDGKRKHQMENVWTDNEILVFGIVFIGVVLRAMAYDKEQD